MIKCVYIIIIMQCRWKNYKFHLITTTFTFIIVSVHYLSVFFLFWNMRKLHCKWKFSMIYHFYFSNIQFKIYFVWDFPLKFRPSVSQIFYFFVSTQHRKIFTGKNFLKRETKIAFRQILHTIIMLIFHKIYDENE